MISNIELKTFEQKLITNKEKKKSIWRNIYTI